MATAAAVQRSDAGVLPWHPLPAALLLCQRRVEAAPWPSARFLNRRHWPTVSSLCRGPTTSPAPPTKQIAGQALARMTQRWVGYEALIHPLHPPQLSFLPSSFSAGGDGGVPKAVAVLPCSLRNSPLLSSLGLHSCPGMDPLSPRYWPFPWSSQGLSMQARLGPSPAGSFMGYAGRSPGCGSGWLLALWESAWLWSVSAHSCLSVSAFPLS